MPKERATMAESTKLAPNSANALKPELSNVLRKAFPDRTPYAQRPDRMISSQTFLFSVQRAVLE